MRKPFIAGNWKMNLNRADASVLAKEIVTQVADESVEVAVCPPCCYLDAVGKVLQEADAGMSRVGLGAQDMYHLGNGAFTGEISSQMLNDLGCRYVILGHSERRQLMGETDEMVNKKVHAALAASLIPIVCVGETLEEREAGRTQSVVKGQLVGSLAELTAEQMSGIVVAYEPVWAIGTGKVATGEQAEEVHADLRSLIESRYNRDVAEAVRIQYGGSVKPDNAAELLAKPNIDGALVGGASLDASSFLAIVRAAKS